MADRYEELRVFVAAVDAGGVNAASEALGLAKSAVSRRISELEARLGARLVDRGGRRLRPTAAGLELHRRGSELLAAWNEMEAGANDRPAFKAIRISAPALLATHVVAPAVAAAIAADPTRSFEIVDEGADANVTLSIPDGHGAGGGRIVGRASQTKVAAPGADATRRVVVGDDGSTGRDRRGELRVPGVDAALAAAIAGAGAVVLPDYVVRAALAAGTLVEAGRPDRAAARLRDAIVATFAPGVEPDADPLIAEIERLLTA